MPSGLTGMAHQPRPSTLLIIERMSRELSPEVVRLVIWRLVEHRLCPLCGAPAGQLCYVYGGWTTLQRTHHQRLRMNSTQRTRVVNWALREAHRQTMDDEDDSRDHGTVDEACSAAEQVFTRDKGCPWWRGPDLNWRPLGYEPNELPSCSTALRAQTGVSARGPW